MKSHWLDTLALILLIVGGLNWGLVALGYNLVEAITAGYTPAENAIYAIVGIAALYLILSVVLARANNRSFFAHS